MKPLTKTDIVSDLYTNSLPSIIEYQCLNFSQWLTALFGERVGQKDRELEPLSGFILSQIFFPCGWLSRQYCYLKLRSKQRHKSY